MCESNCQIWALDSVRLRTLDDKGRLEGPTASFLFEWQEAIELLVYEAISQTLERFISELTN
jgi:hypothetical protein